MAKTLIAVLINIEYRNFGLKEESFGYLGETEVGRSNASHEVKTAISWVWRLNPYVH